MKGMELKMEIPDFLHFLSLNTVQQRLEVVEILEKELAYKNMVKDLDLLLDYVNDELEEEEMLQWKVKER